MDGERSLVSYRIGEYGCVRVKLAEVLNRRGMAKVCYVLNCKIEDLLEYEGPAPI